MSLKYQFGDTKPYLFQLVDSNLDWVTSHSFAAADVKHRAWNGTVWTSWADEGGSCTELGNGTYIWTPSSSSKTQYEIIVLAITDSTGATFLDNSQHIYTGGHADAYFDG